MQQEDAPPLGPISSNDVPWTEEAESPRFALRYRHLSRAVLGDDYRIGVAIEELPPGSQSAPAHYHFLEEEHLFILEGGLTVRIGDETHEMHTGDYLCFPAGQRAGHCLVNNGGAVCRYLIVGERNPREVVVYTDSRKVLVRALGRNAIFDLAATRSYWDGENAGIEGGVPQPFDAVGEVVRTQADLVLPISSQSVKWRTEGGGPRFGGRSKHLTEAAVAGRDHRVGVLIEAPGPGMRLCPTHYHMLEEEHALILEGEVTLILGDERHQMKPGDYVCFPAGQRIGHSFVNSGSGPCSYLMIGGNDPNDICVYPDSNKMLVRGLRTRDPIFDMSGVLDYWDGEGATDG